MQFIMSGNWITGNNHKEEFVVHVYNGIVAAVVVAADCDPFNYSTQSDTTTRPTPTYQLGEGAIHKRHPQNSGIFTPPQSPRRLLLNPSPPPHGRPLHMVTLQHSVPVIRCEYL